MLGPFGTEIGGSGSAGRPSLGASSAGTGRGSPTPGSGLTPAISAGHNSHNSQGSGVYGAGVIPGRDYGRLSEGDEGTEYMGANQAGSNAWGHPTAHSSVEDLLGGQEPSFFSVVLNPRRTLRVVNMD
jgi:hypothetical protein